MFEFHRLYCEYAELHAPHPPDSMSSCYTLSNYFVLWPPQHEYQETAWLRSTIAYVGCNIITHDIFNL